MLTEKIRCQPIKLSPKWDRDRKKCMNCKNIVRCIPPSGFICPHGKKRIDGGIVKK